MKTLHFDEATLQKYQDLKYIETTSDFNQHDYLWLSLVQTMKELEYNDTDIFNFLDPTMSILEILVFHKEILSLHVVGCTQELCEIDHLLANIKGE